MAHGVSPAANYALLIGICFTPKHRRKEWPYLLGCVEDVRLIRDQLTRSLPTIKVRTLTASLSDPEADNPLENEQDLATHANILSSLDDICLKAPDGSFVYVHFTGHGTSIQPTSLYAKSTTGELALVVIAHDNIGQIQYLRGTELANQLRRLVQRGLKVTLALDCCASGSVVRRNFEAGVRWIPYSEAVDEAYPPFQSVQTISGDRSRYHGALSTLRTATASSNWMIDPEGYTVLTACGSTEEARELKIGEKIHGALSYFLVRTWINRGRVGGRQHQLYSHLCARFRDPKLLERNVHQTPMIYGNKHSFFLDDASFDESAATIPVFTGLDGKLRISAGQAHGVTEGDKFTLFPSASASSRKSYEIDARHNILQVTRSSALSSEVDLLNTITTKPGMTAAVHMLSALQNFLILLEMRIPCHGIWQAAIQERPDLRFQYQNTAHSVKTAFSFRVIIHAPNSYEIQDSLSQKILDLPICPYSLEENAEYVFHIVEHLVKFRLVASLTNSLLESPDNNFSKMFDVRLVDTRGTIFQPGCLKNGRFSPVCAHPECIIQVDDGDDLDLVVINNAEAGGAVLYLHFLNMGSSWEIENILPGSYEEIPAQSSNKHDKDFSEGTSGEWSQNITMAIEENIRTAGKRFCDDVFKIFITTQPTSFMFWELPPIYEAPCHQNHPENRGPSISAAGEEWAALSFRVRTSLQHS